MSENSTILVGWPNSGKTNFLAAFWDSLRKGKGRLSAPTPPDDISYVEAALAFQSKGEFAPRSDKDIEHSRRDFAVDVVLKQNPDAGTFSLVVPDVTGELWKSAVLTTEILPDWMETISSASGALLFVRIRSIDNVTPLDWVTTDKFLKRRPSTAADIRKSQALPTQIALCEMLRFLEHSLPKNAQRSRPRVAVIVTAWDLMDGASALKGPEAFLRAEYPMFAGRIADVERLEIKVFGMSAVGGDFGDPVFKARHLDMQTSGYVVAGAGPVQRTEDDVTLPVAWVMGDTSV